VCFSFIYIFFFFALIRQSFFEYFLYQIPRFFRAYPKLISQCSHRRLKVGRRVLCFWPMFAVGRGTPPFPLRPFLYCFRACGAKPPPLNPFWPLHSLPKTHIHTSATSVSGKYSCCACSDSCALGKALKMTKITAKRQTDGANKRSQQEEDPAKHSDVH